MNNRRVSPDTKERKSDPHEKRRTGIKSMHGERGFLSTGKQKEGETCFIGGRNSVLESLRAGQVKKVFIKPGEKGQPPFSAGGRSGTFRHLRY